MSNRPATHEIYDSPRGHDPDALFVLKARSIILGVEVNLIDVEARTAIVALARQENGRFWPIEDKPRFFDTSLIAKSVELIILGSTGHGLTNPTNFILVSRFGTSHCSSRRK